MSDDIQANSGAVTAKCPSQTTLVIALNGVEQVTEAQKEHLLAPGGCEDCERYLDQATAYLCPSPLNLARFGQRPEIFPESSAFGKVLRQHVQTCKENLCMRAAEAIKTIESQ